MLPRRPMLISTSISYAIWLLGGVETLAILGLITHRRLIREFPLFSSYLVFHVSEGILSLLLYKYFGKQSWPSFYEYWITQAIGLILRFGVIYEIFSRVCHPYEGLRRAGAFVLRWVGVLLIVAGIGVAIIGPGGQPGGVLAGAVVLQRSIDVVQCGLLVLLFVFASYFRLSWRNYVFGIALGFGLIATLELLAFALAAESVSISGVIFNFLPRVAYVLGAAIWVAYLVVPEPSRLELKVLPQHDLEKWNQELLQLLQR